MNLSSVNKLRSHIRVKQCLKRFNDAYGDMIISKIKPLDLEEYQSKREDQGIAPATIDMEISITKTMINKAFDNDKVSGHTLKVFRSYKRKLRKGDNVRRRTLSIDEYIKLITEAPSHLKAILIVAYNTGMRLGDYSA